MKHVMTIVAFAALGFPCTARAQEAAPPPSEWGTTWTSTTTVGAYAFVGSMTDGGDGYRICSGAFCRGPLDVPTGVLVWALEVDACDTSATEEVVTRLWSCGPAPGPGVCSIVGEVRSGLAATTGCTRFRGFVTPQFTVNNYNFTYFVDTFGTDGNASVPTRFRGVRIAALRQVSPAPSTVTFGDVPSTHPYHRFVEALAGSLISGGCGNGLFCPDRAVTRGEMAVFLATALGLNFPD